jgi:PAS domain S-box-containing protein
MMKTHEKILQWIQSWQGLRQKVMALLGLSTLLPMLLIGICGVYLIYRVENESWRQRQVEDARNTTPAAAALSHAGELAVHLPPFEAYRMTLLSSALLVAGVVIVTVGTKRFNAWLLTKVLFAPLEELRTGAERIGDGNLTHRLQLKRRDEIGRVATALDNMAGRLSAQTQEREQAEEKRQVSEARYRAIVEDQTELLCRWRPDGTLTFVNAAYCRYFGKTASELIGHSFTPLIVEEDWPVIERHNASLNHANPVGAVEIRMITPDGALRWQQWVDRLIFDPHGTCVEIQSSGRDITEEKQAKSALVASEARLRQITDNMQDVITQLDLDGTIMYASPSHQWILGLEVSSLVGQLIFTRVHPNDQPVVFAFLTRAVSRQGPPRTIVFRVQHANGTYLWMECACSLILDAQSALTGMILSGRDVTARKQVELELMQARDELEQRVQARTVELARANQDLEAEIGVRKKAEEQLHHYTLELERSNQELQQFAYVASHDLQEPLRTVTSYMQLLQRRYRGSLDADADDFIGFAVDGVLRMRELLQGLLDYSRVGSQGKPFEPVAGDFVLEQALANLQVAIQESHATVQHTVLPMVWGDRTQLVQLFQNLIGNAIKFHDGRAPEVEVGAVRQGEQWELWVRDNGIGIESQYQERIFTIFQRLHTRDRYPGTGIGLAVCKRIVERHGGRIWVESTPGEGSTFHFLLNTPAQV